MTYEVYVGRSVRGHQIVDLIKANIKEEIYLQGTKLKSFKLFD